MFRNFLFGISSASFFLILHINPKSVVESVGVFSSNGDFCYDNDPSCDHNSDKWGGVCKTGARQSPINLHVANRKHFQLQYFPLQHFKADRYYINNDGHTLNLDFTPTGPACMIFPGYGLSTTKYVFSKAHLHWGHGANGSEHQVDGNYFNMEVHFVHYAEKYESLENAVKSDDPNALAVVGVFLQVNDEKESNPALLPIFKHLNKVLKPSKKWLRFEETIDFTPLFPKGGHLFSYQGSLTTPTCNEEVNWFVFETPAQISSDDMVAIWKLKDMNNKQILDNHRPIQKVNAREIKYIKTINV